MNIVKNAYRCNYCGAVGGMLDLYMQFHPEVSDRSEAYHAVKKALCIGTDNDWIQPKQRFRTEQTVIPQAKTAMPWEIHKTHSFLFSQLSLSSKHKQDLLRRGLSEEQIERHGYKSTPPFGFTTLAQSVIDNGFAVEGVPGFYVGDDGRWTVRFHAKSSGIIIPILSTSGQIQGAQIRLGRMWAGDSEQVSQGCCQ